MLNDQYKVIKTFRIIKIIILINCKSIWILIKFEMYNLQYEMSTEYNVNISLNIIIIENES